MLSLKDITPTLTDEPVKKRRLPSWLGDHRRRPSFRLPALPSFGRSKPLLGLDIGSSMIKAVLLSRNRDRLHLKQVAIAATPMGALTNGVLTDALIVSHHLRALWEEYRLRARHVAVAAGGEKVYCQTEVLPEDGQKDLKTLVESIAEGVIPYPLRGANLDYQELNGDPQAKQRSVLWVSSVAENVDWLRQAVILAGKTPMVVDAEVCALANVVACACEPPPMDASVILHIGARHMTMALLKGATPLFSRNAIIGQPRRGFEADGLPGMVVKELDRHWEAITKRAHPLSLQRIYLSGGYARAPEVGEALHQRTGLRVRELDPFRRISYTSSGDEGNIVREYGPALAVAVGLALRSFDDL